MPADTHSVFDRKLRLAIDEGKSGRRELLRRLAAMPIDEIAQLSPLTLAMIGPQGVAALAKRRSDVAALSPLHAPIATIAKPDRRRPAATRHPLRWAACLAFVVLGSGLGADLARPAITARWLDPGSRPISTETWPLCPRLDPWIDGCVYLTGGTALTLKRAADLLAIPVDQLTAINRHLTVAPLAPLPPDSFIAVWRGRLLLEGTR